MASRFRVSSDMPAVGMLALAVTVLIAAADDAYAQARLSPKGPAESRVSQATPLSRPTWSELTASQREALAPLAPHWDGLSENHRRKWIALSRNFDSWPAGEQAKMHARMIDWAGLSTVERAQARLNFAEASKLAPDEKKARWEQYQALSEEQRGKLAAAAPLRRPGAASAVKLTGSTPVARPGSEESLQRQMTTRVSLPAMGVDHNTLLPQQRPAP